MNTRQKSELQAAKTPELLNRIDEIVILIHEMKETNHVLAVRV
jgi:hypothetical protein